MFLDSPLVIDSRMHLEALLYDSIQVLFGVKPANLNNALLDSLFLAITDRFINITILDIQNSFRYAEIEKKQYVSLTRDEILQPIKDYWFKKGILISKIDQFDNKTKEEREEIEKAKIFKEEAKQLYLKSFKDEKFYLTEAHCSVIGANFAIHLTPERRAEIKIEAKKEHAERISKEKIVGYSIIPMWQWIFARIWIEECLNKGYKFIQD